ncbi:MAG: Uncharacterised protein [Euryarchaeota archaeon UBA443]|nr:MAG: Uncharacterised protein [Euryarchaeota archaeon UBA443]
MNPRILASTAVVNVYALQEYVVEITYLLRPIARLSFSVLLVCRQLVTNPVPKFHHLDGVHVQPFDHLEPNLPMIPRAYLMAMDVLSTTRTLHAVQGVDGFVAQQVARLFLHGRLVYNEKVRPVSLQDCTVKGELFALHPPISVLLQESN